MAADFPSAWPKVAALSGARAGWWWFFSPSGPHQKPGWWLSSLSHPSEKWWSSSVGMMKFPIYGGQKSHAPNHRPETNEPMIIWINSRKPSSVGPYAMHRIWSFWSGKGPPKKTQPSSSTQQKSLSFNCLALGRTNAGYVLYQATSHTQMMHNNVEWTNQSRLIIALWKQYAKGQYTVYT